MLQESVLEEGHVATVPMGGAEGKSSRGTLQASRAALSAHTAEGGLGVAGLPVLRPSSGGQGVRWEGSSDPSAWISAPWFEALRCPTVPSALPVVYFYCTWLSVGKVAWRRPPAGRPLVAKENQHGL